MYTLIGTDVSYFTGKLRSYLRFKGVPFEERLATAQVYRDVILPRTGVHYIPVLLTPEGMALQDTSEIIDTLEARHGEPTVTPETPRQRLAALWLEVFGDEWMVLPAMHYRWNFKRDNLAYVLREFGSTAHPDWPAPLRSAGGLLPAMLFGNTPPLLGITRATWAAIESFTEWLFDVLDAHFAAHPFLFGTRPSIGDFGLMGSMYAHLYRDPHSGRLMRTRAPRLARWVERMNEPQQAPGAFLPDDEVPATLEPLLARVFLEQWPVLRDTSARLARWVERHPHRRLPRTIGMHRFTLGGASARRVVFPYAQWMLQRPLATYAQLSDSTRESVDPWLRRLGGLEANQFTPRVPLARVGNRLVTCFS